MKLSKCLKRKLANGAYNVFVSKDDIINMIHLYQDKTAHLLCDESNRQGKFNSNHYVNSFCVQDVPLIHRIAYAKFILIKLEEKLNRPCLLQMVNETDAVTIRYIKISQQISDKDETNSVYLQMLHQDCHHHVHKDKLCHQNEHNKEDGGDERADTAIGQTFFGGIAVVTQCVLNTEKAKIQSVINNTTRILLHTCIYFTVSVYLFDVFLIAHTLLC